MYLYPILSAIGAVLVLVGEIIKSDKVPPGSTDWPKMMVIAGGVMVIIVAFLDAIDTGRQQGRLETLAGETKDLVTGGKSIVWIRLTEDPSKPDSFTANLVHTGDVVPAFDVDIEIIQTGVCDGLEPWTMGHAVTSGVGNPRIQFVPGFGPDTIKSLRGQFKPSCDNAYYVIIIQSRNRSVIEQILLKKTDGKWQKAIRVQELFADKNLLDEIDTGFVAAGEKVKWPDLTLIRKTVESLKGVRPGRMVQ